MFGTTPSMEPRSVALRAMLGPSMTPHRGVKVGLPQLQFPRSSSLKFSLLGVSAFGLSVRQRHSSGSPGRRLVPHGGIDIAHLLCVPPLRLRQPVDGPHELDLSQVWHPHKVRVRQGPVAQHHALHSTGVEGTSIGAVRPIDREVDIHELAKPQEPLVEGLPTDSLVGHEPIWSHCPDREHPRGILDQPGHDGMAQRDLLVETALEIQLIGPEDPSELLHRSLDLPIAGMVIGGRVLLEDLLRAFQLYPRLRHCVAQELEDGRLIV